MKYKAGNIKKIGASRVFKNFGHLGILQVFNLIIPLLIYPYLIRILGKEVYGIYVYAQAIIAYFSILVNFGFNISGTQSVATNKNNLLKLREIITSVYVLKGVFFVISLFCLFLLVLFFPLFRQNWLLFVLTMHVCLYEFLLPIWYFQGIEDMKYITIVNVISKVFSSILILLFVKESGHLLRVPLFNLFGTLLAIGYSILLLYKKFGIRPIRVSFRKLFGYFQESLVFFISNVSIQIYTNANKVIVGSFLGMGQVALYDLAEKVITLLRIPVRMANQALFPSMANRPDLNKIFLVIKGFLIVNIVVTILIYFFGEFFVQILGGKEMLNSHKYLVLYCLILFPVVYSTFIGMYLICIDKRKIFVKILSSGTILYLILFVILFIIKKIELNTIISINVLTEMFIAIIMFFVLKGLKNE